ncbi:MAG: pyridoxamine 5'-phosphate oxidase [Cyanothece sp. SIO2G6]|nr:pyridoxamine 5'-phosphate oxidase [Cyanothece sp. SIO2G6]
MQAIPATKTLLQQQSFGVLSTHSVDVAGFPFGSVTPYSLTLDYHPLIYISNIAQHTQNIIADSRVALTILADTPPETPKTDPQTRPRITILGHAIPVLPDDPASDALHQIYFNQFPDAQAILSQLGFHLYHIQPVRLRYIGGFGKICWVEPEQLKLG